MRQIKDKTLIKISYLKKILYLTLKKHLTNSLFCVTIDNMKPDELITWRQKKGLTQMALAAMLGVTRACVSRWESGERKIPAFLHLALKCLKVKRGGEGKERKGKGKRKKEVKR